MSFEADSGFAASVSRGGFLRRVGTGAVALSGLGALAPSVEASPLQHHAATGAPRKPTGTLRVANPGEPNFISPADALEITELGIDRNVYDGLTAWNTDYTQIVPSLATAWHSNADATEWTFELRKGVYFHDGTPFNSTAVRKTIEYYQGKTWGLIWQDVKHIDDSKPTVVKISFTAPSPDLARNQTLAMMVSPKLLAENAETRRAVGTGPYRFKEWNKGKAFILDANPHYWGVGPYLSEIQFETIPDKTAEVTALMAGDVDLVMKVAPEQFRSLAHSSRLGTSTKTSWVEGHVILRCDVPPTNDVRVRRALAYAIDRDALVRDVLLGQGVSADTPMPLGTYGRVNPPTKYPYDPEKAKSLLKDAGHGNGLNLSLVDFKGIRVLGSEICQAVAGMLSQVGVNVRVDVLDPGVAIKDLLAKRPQHQMFHAEYGWSNGGPFHLVIGSATGHAHYTGAKLLNLDKRIGTTPDGPERLRLIGEAQNVFMEELPHIPLYYLVLSDVFSKSVHGYSNPKDGYLPRFGPAYLS